MRRKFLIGALTLLGLISLLIVSVIVYVRSGRLDRWLQDQVVESLSETGIRAEIGSLNLDITGYRVTLADVKLFDRKSNKLLGSVQRIQAQFSVVDYLKQRINITAIDVLGPEVWIELDEKGRFNLQNLHSPPERRKKENKIVFLTAEITLSGGRINFADRQHNISAILPDLSGKFVPRDPSALEDRINHRLTLSFKNGAGSYEGKPIQHIRSELESNVSEDRADIDKLMISSDLGETAANGQVLSFSALKYQIKARSDLSAGEAARIFRSDLRMSGRVTFDGNIDGTGGDYHVVGGVTSDSLTADGYRISGLAVRTSIIGSGANYSGNAEARSRGVNGRESSSENIKLTARVIGRGSDVGVSGALSLSSFKSGSVVVSGLEARLEADRSRVTMPEITASVLGGRLSGSASIAYAGGESRVGLVFKSIDLEQVADLVSPKEVKVSGTADGTANLAFPALNYKAAAGRLIASFTAAVAASRPEAVDAAAPAEPTPLTHSPATGELGILVTGRGFNLEKAIVRSAKSKATASGSIDWNAVGSLSVSFESEDMSEVYRAIDALGFVSAGFKEEFEPSLSGPGEFRGRVEGSLSAPAVSGHLRLDALEMHAQPLGSFEGDVAYLPQQAGHGVLRIQDASMVSSEGSRAEFSLEVPFPTENNASIRARLENFDLPSVVRAAVPGLSKIIGRGIISGTLDLKGLPGSRSLTGTADIALTGAEFNIPAGEDEEQPKKRSVQEFTGKVTIANSVISVENLRMQLGDSTISGVGTFNISTYEYSITTEGKNIDLANVSDAFSETTRLAGRADVIVKGQGDWDDWSTTRLNAAVQGRGVTFEGRPLGDAKVTASTQDGTLKLEATGELSGEPHHLVATIDLRDRENYPVNANVEFTDTEIGPYLKLISPQLAKITGHATGTIKLTGPLKDIDRVQAVANLTRLELGGKLAEGRSYSIANQGNIIVKATPKEVTLEEVTFTGEGTSVTIGGTLWRGGEAAAGATGKSDLSIKGEINLRLVSSFTEVVYTTGVARVQASVVGSLDSPRLTGFVDLRDVGVRIVNFPISMARGSGQIRFTEDQARIENFAASAPGGGKLSIAGGAALSGLTPDRWRLEANADQVGVEYPLDTQTVFDGSFVLQGNRTFQVLSGDVKVRRASYTKDITIADLLTTGGPFSSQFIETGPGGGGGPGPPVTLDVRITADNTLVVRNNLADAAGSAYLNLRGPVQEPLVSGRLLLSRGTIEFRNDRYELTRGLIVFPGTRGAEPIIDLQPERDIAGYHITIGLNGPMSKLRTTLRADPELPDQDILSLILEGRLSSDRATSAALAQSGLGLAQTILSASLYEQIERRTQRLFGLSRFSIDPLLAGRGGDPTAKLTLGQRVTKDLTITYSQNLTSGSSGLERIVLVEYRLSNRLSIVGIRDDRGDVGFDVRIRKRF